MDLRTEKSLDKEEAFNKAQRSFIINALNKLEMKGNYPNLIKTLCGKSTASIILCVVGELKALSLTSGVKQVCQLPLIYSG